MYVNHSPKLFVTRRLGRFKMLLLAILALLIASCSSDSIPDVGPRPAAELSSVVEAYLQQYQPGPLPRLFQTSYIYDRNGELLAELYSEGRRSWVSLDQVSSHLINATVATEDATFFINTGIDPLRIAGAALQNIEEGDIVSGASTITMQLARNLFMGANERYDQSFDRKIVEAGLARELNETYNKEEVLEMYLNTLNYGQLAYGPQAAARIYFDKSAEDLTLAEASLLAGIPQQPARLNPYINFQLTRQRQRVVLDLMVRHGYLTTEEADDVYAEPIILNPNPGLPEIRAPHFVNYLIAELDSRLGAGYVRRGGLHIYSTLDLTLQEVAQEVVASKVAELRPRYDMNNAALVAMKPGTAEILAMVGSIDYNNRSVDGQVNVATRMRQPGSAIKPVLYSMALDDNMVSPATVIWDTPVRYKIEGQPDYEPRNYDRKFHGPVTVRGALANSYNIPAIKLMDQVGVTYFLERARSMGINSFTRDPSWYGLSLTLGGGEVTLLDLTTAYHTMANAGMSLPARPVLAIHDSNGVSMIDDAEFSRGRRAISEAAAFLITDIMSDNQARVPMFGANSWLNISRPAAAKTGTTDDNRDSWTVGYTRYLVAGVWSGNTQGRPMQGATGASVAAAIWNAFMERIIRDSELLVRIDAPADAGAWAFAAPPDVELHNTCPPGVTCRQDGGEYFSNEWLQLAALSGGPLSDSVVRAPSLSVYRNQQLVGYCLEDRGVVRDLVRLPARFGPPGLVMLAEERNLAVGEKQASIAANIVPPGADISQIFTEDTLIDLAINSRQLSDEMLSDRRNALDYTGPMRRQVSLGPCDEVQRFLGSVFIDRNEIGRSNATVRVRPMDLRAQPAPVVEPIAEAPEAEEVEEPAEEVEEPVEEIAPEPEPVVVEEPRPTPASAGRYQLANVYHNDACPGRYIMGRVINWEGGPVAGVRLSLVDGWGNYYEAVTKSGPTDFGHFDFPLYSDSPQDLRLTVLDGGGSPISPTVIVPHRRSAESEFPCHHVTFQGG
jgi:penicillin-binding protein 1C